MIKFSKLEPSKKVDGIKSVKSTSIVETNGEDLTIQTLITGRPSFESLFKWLCYGHPISIKIINKISIYEDVIGSGTSTNKSGLCASRSKKKPKSEGDSTSI